MFPPKRSRSPPIFFYISDVTNLSSYSGKSLGKKSMLENFEMNVLKSVVWLKMRVFAQKTEVNCEAQWVYKKFF